jgi:hypothetical protein
MSNFYDSFINKYSVKHVQVVRDRNFETINYGYNQTAGYYTNREELIEIEITRSGFEQLVRIDHEYDLLWQDQRSEAWMRKRHPAISEAYDKYKMLLELYR